MPEADLVVYGSLQTLLASEILFRRLHRDVAEQELDLPQFASGCMTQACTGPAKVVWRDFRKASLPDVFLTTVSDLIKGAPYYEVVEPRLVPLKDWSETADPELRVRGRFLTGFSSSRISS